MGNRSSGDKVVDEQERKDCEEKRGEEGEVIGGASSRVNCDELLMSDSSEGRPEEERNSVTLASRSPSGSGDNDGRPSPREMSQEHEQECEEVRLSLVLCCDDSAERKTLKFPAGLPADVEGLKNAIQSELRIPVPCQKIFFESALLLDRDSLRYCRIRDGDTLQVHYNSDADVKGIQQEVEMLEEVITHVKVIQPELADQDKVYRRDIDAQISRMRPAERIRDLAYSYFSPLLSEESKANVACFAHYSGIDLLSQLHALVLKHPWERTPLTLQRIELAVLCVWWKLSAMLGARMFLVDTLICNCLVQSALRVTVKPNERVCAPQHVLRTSHFNQNTLLSKVIFEAVGTLCNLAEIPSCAVEFASNHDLMQQFTAIILSPSYIYHAQLVTTAGLVCLAYSSQTHQHLARINIINNVMDACKPHVNFHRTPNTLLLRYFSALILAQLVTTSLSVIPDEYVDRILLFLHSFLKTANPERLHEEEERNSFFWFTVLPHMTLAYCPPLPAYNVTKQSAAAHSRVVIRTLHLCCVELGVLSLQNILREERHQKVLREEGLVDFATCMPWYLPEGTSAHTRACQLTASLRPLLRQPPSLLNITRAKLASTCFGLDCVLNKTVRELLSTA